MRSCSNTLFLISFPIIHFQFKNCSFQPCLTILCYYCQHIYDYPVGLHDKKKLYFSEHLSTVVYCNLFSILSGGSIDSSHFLGSVKHQSVTAPSVMLANFQIHFLACLLKLANVSPVVLVSLGNVKVCKCIH